MKIIELKPDNISIDMIELSINVDTKNFKRNINPVLDTFGNSPELEYKRKTYWKSYTHNWNWKTEKYSIQLFYVLNSGNSETSDRFKLKYNPNKVDPDDRFLRTMLPIFKYLKPYPVISWFDVAFDYMGLTTNDIIFDKGKKNIWGLRGYPNTEPTIYLGKSGTNGSVKIYDKANEETNNQADYNKTRFEVTIRDKVPLNTISSWECNIDMPKLYLKQILGLYDDDKLSPTEKLLVHSVETGFPLEKLTYRQKVRYGEIMQKRREIYTEIKPSQLDIEKAIQNFVKQSLN